VGPDRAEGASAHSDASVRLRQAPELFHLAPATCAALRRAEAGSRASLAQVCQRAVGNGGFGRVLGVTAAVQRSPEHADGVLASDLDATEFLAGFVGALPELLAVGAVGVGVSILLGGWGTLALVIVGAGATAHDSWHELQASLGRPLTGDDVDEFARLFLRKLVGEADIETAFTGRPAAAAYAGDPASVGRLNSADRGHALAVGLAKIAATLLSARWAMGRMSGARPGAARSTPGLVRARLGAGRADATGARLPYDFDTEGFEVPTTAPLVRGSTPLLEGPAPVLAAAAEPTLVVAQLPSGPAAVVIPPGGPAVESIPWPILAPQPSSPTVYPFLFPQGGPPPPLGGPSLPRGGPPPRSQLPTLFGRPGSPANDTGPPSLPEAAAPPQWSAMTADGAVVEYSSDQPDLEWGDRIVDAGKRRPTKRPAGQPAPKNQAGTKPAPTKQAGTSGRGKPARSKDTPARTRRRPEASEPFDLDDLPSFMDPAARQRLVERIMTLDQAESDSVLQMLADIDELHPLLDGLYPAEEIDEIVEALANHGHLTSVDPQMWQARVAAARAELVVQARISAIARWTLHIFDTGEVLPFARDVVVSRLGEEEWKRLIDSYADGRYHLASHTIFLSPDIEDVGAFVDVAQHEVVHSGQPARGVFPDRNQPPPKGSLLWVEAEAHAAERESARRAGRVSRLPDDDAALLAHIEKLYGQSARDRMAEFRQAVLKATGRQPEQLRPLDRSARDQIPKSKLAAQIREAEILEAWQDVVAEAQAWSADGSDPAEVPRRLAEVERYFADHDPAGDSGQPRPQRPELESTVQYEQVGQSDLFIRGGPASYRTFHFSAHAKTPKGTMHLYADYDWVARTLTISRVRSENRKVDMVTEPGPDGQPVGIHDLLLDAVRRMAEKIGPVDQIK